MYCKLIGISFDLTQQNIFSMQNKNERINRIIARGEVSGHCHVIVGDNVTVTRNSEGQIIVEVGGVDAVLKHIMETPWVESGIHKWTEEHKDIPLKRGIYEFVQQTEFDPYLKLANAIKD